MTLGRRQHNDEELAHLSSKTLARLRATATSRSRPLKSLRASRRLPDELLGNNARRLPQKKSRSAQTDDHQCGFHWGHVAKSGFLLDRTQATDMTPNYRQCEISQPILQLGHTDQMLQQARIHKTTHVRPMSAQYNYASCYRQRRRCCNHGRQKRLQQENAMPEGTKLDR